MVHRSSLLGLPGYAVALWLVVFPAVDLVILAVPLSPTIVEWRYSFTEVLSRSLMTPVLGIFVALVLTTAFRHVRIAKVLRVSAAIAAAVLLLLLVVFIVDSTGLRSGAELRRGMAPLFGGAWFAAVGKVALATVTLGLVAWVARVDPEPAAPREGQVEGHRGSDGSPPLLGWG